MMQDKESLTLQWRKLLGGGSDIVPGSVTHRGGRYFDYGLRRLHRPSGIQHARPEIIDAPLKLILEGSSYIINTIFDHFGGQHLDYTLMSLHSSSIIQDAQMIIVDSTLTLIFRRY